MLFSIAERVIVTVSELWAGMVPVNANSLLALSLSFQPERLIAADC